MTAILTLENCELTDVTTVSHNAIYSVPSSYTHAYLVEGEELTIYQLLNVLLIPSANDAAFVLAEHIAGSVESFCTMMNTKALELGCKDTHFVNPNGIHESEHYSTAYDLALMGRYAMQFETFRKIVTTTSYTLPSTNKYEEANRFFKQTNALIVPDERDSVDNYYYLDSTGIKTGYTNPAGECIVASAKRNDIEYIVVILGAGKLENGLSARYTDCKNLFNYAFENFTTYTVNEENTVLKQLKISKANIFNNKLDVVVQDKITLLLKKDTSINNISPIIDISKELVAPINKNTVVGTISYTVDGNTYTSNLLAGNDIGKSNLWNAILIIVSIILILLLLHRLQKLNNKKKTIKKRKKFEKRDYLYW